MEKINYGTSQTNYSRLIAGCMRWGTWGANLDTSGFQKNISRCLELGITSFDHADIYGGYSTEKDFGDALKGMNLNRDDFQIITKCGIQMPCDNKSDFYIKCYEATKEYIVQCVEDILVNLGLEKIDMLLFHRPSPLMNVHEIAEAFTSLKRSGKVDDFGVSNFTPIQFDALNNLFPLCTNQLEISVMHRDFFFDDVHFYQSKNIAIQAWSPLAGGILFDESQKNETVERLKNLNKKYNWDMSEMAMQFLWHHSCKISPVLGTANMDRIKQTLNHLNNRITNQQWFEIWTEAQGFEVP